MADASGEKCVADRTAGTPATARGVVTHGEWGPVIAVLGPTAVGKSALALELARRFGGEIVSADSRQVYRYMDVGTAKPTAAEQAEVAHWMLDLVAPDQQYSAQLFHQEGRAVLRRMAAQRRPAFVVGGTGFYVQALLDGIGLPAVPPDLELRSQLRAEARRDGAAALHARLAAVDAASAARIHPNNLPRLVRALEIVTHLGGPVPALTSDEIPALFLGLDADRAGLKQVADRRVAAQVRNGLAEETRLLLAMGYGGDLPSLQGFGYRQMVEYIMGTLDLQAAVRAYEVATHAYIRRQLTWFRRDTRILWLATEKDLIDRASQAVERYLATV